MQYLNSSSYLLLESYFCLYLWHRWFPFPDFKFNVLEHMLCWYFYVLEEEEESSLISSDYNISPEMLDSILQLLAFEVKHYYSVA